VGVEVALVRFKGEGTAVLRYADAKARSPDDARWAREVGFVEHHRSGRLLLRGTFAGHYLDVDESDHVSQKGAAEGGVAGGLIGVLGGPPGIALGLLIGGVAGGEVGAVSDAEDEPRLLADQLRAEVPNSSSAIALISEASDVDEMLAALGEQAQDVSRRALTPEDAARLEESLAATPKAAP
jgi:uncharacterized membrane protein